MNKKNAIFFVVDDLYFHYFKACIHSIKKNYTNHPDILVCYSGNNTYNLNFLKSIPRNHIVHYSDLSNKYGFTDTGIVRSLHIYERYRLWSDEFSDYDNILHLDADLIVLQPLDSLFDLNEFFIVENNVLIRDSKIFYEKYKNDLVLKKMLLSDGLKYPDKFNFLCNAGVFMIPKKYRNKKNLLKLIDLTRKYKSYLRFADQSAISLWCMVNNITPSSQYDYNFQIGFLFREKNNSINQLLKNVKILHFSNVKPDMEEFNTYFDQRFKENLKNLYFSYLFFGKNSLITKILYYLFQKRKVEKYSLSRFR